MAKYKATGYGAYRGSAAHRAVWTAYNGPIPDGLFLLHKCDVKACVNPEHLSLGTQADNIRDMINKGRDRRGNGGGRFNREKTHCLNGHELSPENIYTYPGKNIRRCKICQRARIKASKARAKLKLKESRH